MDGLGNLYTKDVDCEWSSSEHRRDQETVGITEHDCGKCLQPAKTTKTENLGERSFFESWKRVERAHHAPRGDYL